MLKNAQKWVKRHPIRTLLIATMLVSGSTSFGNISTSVETAKNIKKIADDNNAEEMKVQVSKEHEDAQAKIAEERYKSGCIMIVAGQDENSYTSLSEGFPVVDRTRRKPLPTGTVVCDANGNTGVMVRQKDESGKTSVVVGAVAFTGNKSIVKMAQGRSTRRYYIPNQS